MGGGSHFGVLGGPHLPHNFLSHFFSVRIFKSYPTTPPPKKKNIYIYIYSILITFFYAFLHISNMAIEWFLWIWWWGILRLWVEVVEVFFASPLSSERRWMILMNEGSIFLAQPGECSQLVGKEHTILPIVYNRDHTLFQKPTKQPDIFRRKKSTEWGRTHWVN